MAISIYQTNLDISASLKISVITIIMKLNDKSLLALRNKNKAKTWLIIIYQQVGCIVYRFFFFVINIYIVNNLLWLFTQTGSCICQFLKKKKNLVDAIMIFFFFYIQKKIMKGGMKISVDNRLFQAMELFASPINKMWTQFQRVSLLCITWQNVA